MPDHKLLLALWIGFVAVWLCRPAEADPSSPLPAVIVKTRTADMVVQPDGGYTTIFHEEKLATNDGAAHNIAQRPIDYTEGMEAVEILDAFTRKADGKVVAVDLTRLVARSPPALSGVMRFADHKQKVIVFPEVTAGDTAVFTISRTGKMAFAGQFFAADVFQRGLAVAEVRESITIPRAMGVHVEAQGVDH